MCKKIMYIVYQYGTRSEWECLSYELLNCILLLNYEIFMEEKKSFFSMQGIPVHDSPNGCVT